MRKRWTQLLLAAGFAGEEFSEMDGCTLV